MSPPRGTKEYVISQLLIFFFLYVSFLPHHTLFISFIEPFLSQAVKKDMPMLNKTQSWSAVASYVGTITTGEKDDDDPRFRKAETVNKEPPDCFPKQIFNKWDNSEMLLYTESFRELSW